MLIVLLTGYGSRIAEYGKRQPVRLVSPSSAFVQNVGGYGKPLAPPSPLRFVAESTATITGYRLIDVDTDQHEDVPLRQEQSVNPGFTLDIYPDLGNLRPYLEFGADDG